jgi:hypothetical protein
VTETGDRPAWRIVVSAVTWDDWAVNAFDMFVDALITVREVTGDRVSLPVATMDRDTYAAVERDAPDGLIERDGSGLIVRLYPGDEPFCRIVVGDTGRRGRVVIDAGGPDVWVQAL